MSFRKCLLEYTGLGGSRQVSVQNYEIFVFLAKLYQCVSIAVPGCNLLYF